MFSEVIKIIKDAKKIAILNHEHPDGDALGSSYALKLALEDMGKCAEVFLRDGDCETVEFSLLDGTKKTGLEFENCDLKIAVDCADKKRLGELSEGFAGKTVAIDHHVTHENFADFTIVVPDAPATGEIIFDLLREMDVEITREIAKDLYIAIVCDTGNLKYSSTTPKTLLTVAELIKTGIDFADISKRLFDTKSIEYLKAYKMGIERLELFADGKISLLALSEKDFESVGIDEKKADGLTTLPTCVEGAEVAVYIRQRGENEYKVSLRSNTDFDVAEVAVKFGGGGHVKASGFTLKLPLDEVKKIVIEELKKSLRK